MNNKYDLNEFKQAKEDLKEIPRLMKVLDSFKDKLYPHYNYFDARQVINSILEAKGMLELKMFIATRIVKSKGKYES